MTSSTQQVKSVVNELKSGLKTTEFYLSSFVTLVGTILQFLPSSEASEAVKVTGFIAAVLSALGYTVGRSMVKNGVATSTTTTVGNIPSVGSVTTPTAPITTVPVAADVTAPTLQS